MRFFAQFLLLACIVVAGCGRRASPAPGTSAVDDASNADSKKIPPATAVLDFKTEYQAIFLVNGQGVIGRVKGSDGPYLVLTDVYYMQPQVDATGKRALNILVKRGNEWHGPERMYLNSAHVVLIEPVSPNSEAAQLINKMKNQPVTPPPK